MFRVINIDDREKSESILVYMKNISEWYRKPLWMRDTSIIKSIEKIIYKDEHYEDTVSQEAEEKIHHKSSGEESLRQEFKKINNKKKVNKAKESCKKEKR